MAEYAAAATRLRLKSVKPGAQVYVRGNRPQAYTAVNAGAVNPRLARWRWNTGGPNTIMGYALTELRDKARDASRRDALADNGLEVMVTNIVGTGIKPQWNTPNSVFNQRIGQLWLDWTDESDADGRFDFYGQQSVAVRSMFEGGDCFARMRVRRPEDGLLVPFQVQLLEGDFCPVNKNEPRAQDKPNYIQNGVEFDLIGRRRGYHLYQEHPGDYSTNPDTVFVAASEIAHLALSGKRIGQIRGEPALARALVKLRDLDIYDEAQLVRQQVAALHAGFITPQAEGMFSGEGDQAAAIDANGTALVTLEPGLMQVLGPGEDVKFSTPPSPGDSYAVYVAHQERRVATAIGVLYEQLTGDYSAVNDRQWRAAINEFRRRIERIQHQTVVFQLCRPIMWRFVEIALMNRNIILPADVSFRQAVTPKWLPQAWPYINPEQDVNTKIKEMRSGLRSRAHQVSTDGYDVEAVDAEIAADNIRADTAGLIFDSDPRKTTVAGLYQVGPEPIDPATQN